MLLQYSRFLSTLSLRRATLWSTWIASIPRDFYPRSPCGERLFAHVVSVQHGCISIHALLAESDNSSVNTADQEVRFLSTLSLRRATPTAARNNKNNIFLSTLSLRRATVHYDNYNLHCVISIHALLAESDYDGLIASANFCKFLSTLSLRRATWLRCWKLAARDISIHALLAESDGSLKAGQTYYCEFLSTLSLRRATRFQAADISVKRISIHALLAESDPTRPKIHQ